MRIPPDDNRVYLEPLPWVTEMEPVTRVLPSCGHIYFLKGHNPDKTKIKDSCRKCRFLDSIKMLLLLLARE